MAQYARPLPLDTPRAEAEAPGDLLLLPVGGKCGTDLPLAPAESGDLLGGLSDRVRNRGRSGLRLRLGDLSSMQTIARPACARWFF